MIITPPPQKVPGRRRGGVPALGVKKKGSRVLFTAAAVTEKEISEEGPVNVTATEEKA